MITYHRTETAIARCLALRRSQVAGYIIASVLAVAVIAFGLARLDSANVQNAVAVAYESKTLQDLRSIESAADVYYVMRAHPPNTVGDLVLHGYIPSTITSRDFLLSHDRGITVTNRVALPSTVLSGLRGRGACLAFNVSSGAHRVRCPNSIAARAAWHAIAAAPWRVLPWLVVSYAVYITLLPAVIVRLYHRKASLAVFAVEAAMASGLLCILMLHTKTWIAIGCALLLVVGGLLAAAIRWRGEYLGG